MTDLRSRPPSGLIEPRTHCATSGNGHIPDAIRRPQIPRKLLAAGSLDAYIQSIRNIPILDTVEELQLARRYRLQGDAKDAQTLALSSLRFVVHVARGYLGYGLAFADLIQAGNVGLLRAVKRFDPAIGVRLIAFAVHWIKHEIHEFILKNWKIVKVATTKTQRKLFFNLRRYKKRLGWMSKAEVDLVATDLRVPVADVLHMEARLWCNDIAFDVTDIDDVPHFFPEQHLADNSDAIAEIEGADWTERCLERLGPALLTLDERSLEIVQRRWLCGPAIPATLQALGDKYGVSAERIRQIQQQALDLLRIAVESVELKSEPA